MSVRNLLLVPAALVLIAPVVEAHHSPSAFDMTQEIVIEGTVVALEWKNPHIYFTLETTGADDGVRQYEVEAPPVGSVRTYGVSREDLEPGTRIVLRANPGRREGGTVRALSFAASDGSVKLLDATGAGTVSMLSPSVPAAGLAGRWALPPAAFLSRVLAPLPLTATAQAAVAQAMSAADAQTLCGKEIPPPYLAPVLYEIDVTAAEVVIRTDGDGDVARRISLTETTHPAGLAPSASGHAIGHWEGNTLVVETAGFAPQVTGRGLPLGPGTRLVERFALTDDRLHLSYEVRIEDPENFTEPVAYAMQWDHRPELEPSGLPCDAGSDRRYLQYR